MAGTVQIVNKIKARDFNAVNPATEFATIKPGSAIQDDMGLKLISGNAFFYVVGGTLSDPLNSTEIKDRKFFIKDFMEYVWRHGIVGDEMMSKTAGQPIKVLSKLSGGSYAVDGTNWNESWNITNAGAASFTSLTLSNLTGIMRANGSSAVSALAITNGALYATGNNTGLAFGTLPIAQGGTGITTSSTPNQVFATAASGATATAPIWKTLVAADIPNLDTAKLTSGTLSVARGGTGATTFTSGNVLIGNGTGAITTRGIDTTSGGTSLSTSLITSGAVYSGFANTLPVKYSNNVHTDTFTTIGIYYGAFTGSPNHNDNRVAGLFVLPAGTENLYQVFMYGMGDYTQNPTIFIRQDKNKLWSSWMRLAFV